MRRLSKPGKLNTAAKIGVFAVNGGRPILSKSEKDIVGLPGLFDADLLAELTEEDRFLGPMKKLSSMKTLLTSTSSGLIWPNSGPRQRWLMIA